MTLLSIDTSLIMKKTICRNLSICKSIALITSIGVTDWLASVKLALLILGTLLIWLEK